MIFFFISVRPPIGKYYFLQIVISLVVCRLSWRCPLNNLYATLRENQLAGNFSNIIQIVYAGFQLCDVQYAS